MLNEGRPALGLCATLHLTLTPNISLPPGSQGYDWPKAQRSWQGDEPRLPGIPQWMGQPPNPYSEGKERLLGTM